MFKTQYVTLEVYCFVETDLREISHIQLISSFIGTYYEIMFSHILD